MRNMSPLGLVVPNPPASTSLTLLSTFTPITFTHLIHLGVVLGLLITITCIVVSISWEIMGFFSFNVGKPKGCTFFFTPLTSPKAPIGISSFCFGP